MRLFDFVRFGLVYESEAILLLEAGATGPFGGFQHAEQRAACIRLNHSCLICRFAVRC
jgi:hypothetical protein